MYFNTCMYCGAPLTGAEKYLGECDACYSSYFSYTKEKLNFSEGTPRFAHWKLFQMSVPRLSLYLFRLLSEQYKAVTMDKNREYIYAQGDIPILLVAHMDTVHKELPKVEQDLQQNILWSKTGLGADDRAGIAAIIELLDQGYRPHVLFTDKEESGGAGASAFIRDFKTINVNCIIELDRRGSDDSVFYNCDNTEFEKYITLFGFKTSYGSFSDISRICPELSIAGVNLSVGYYNAHCSSEYLKIDEWEKTVERVKNILTDPPTEKFIYVPRYSWSSSKSYYGGSNYSYNYDSKYDRTYETYDDLYEDDITGISAGVGDINVNIDVLELVYSLGGTIVDWQDFLEDNKGEIERRIRESVLDEVYNLCTSKMPEFLVK